MAEIMISSRKLNEKMAEAEEKSRRKIHFSKIELKDLLKAWLAISIAFTILNIDNFNLLNFIILLFISAFTVGTGFLIHELAHKLTAQHYGCWAEFRAFNEMLFFAIIMSFFGFLFVAPGAVMIQGSVNKEKNGKIAFAGPLMNIVVALLFFILSKIKLASLITEIAGYGFMMNSWFALFNMIPFGIFDGAKVFRWNKAIFGIFAAVTLAIILFLPAVL